VWAAEGAARIATDPLVDVARVVTELGSLPVTAAVAAVTAAWALVRRRPIDAVALAAGVVLAVAAVHVAKAAYGRDRPVDMLVPAALEAYPSGHTAYAVTLVACAVVLVRGGVGWAARFAAVSVAVAAVVVVGFTRVYLRVHFLTDVLGGAALTVALWSAIGALALVAGHVRHNGRRS
jgi:undecaprenyl-diphosphatase